MASTSAQGKLTGFGYKKVKQVGEERWKMRPNTIQWWRIDSYFHLLVLKSLPNKLASWCLFPRQGLVLLWQAVAYMIHRGLGSPSGVIGGVGGIKMECVKADMAARCCLAGEGPRLQLHAWLRASQGSSSGDLLVSNCCSCCREQSQQSYNPPGDGLGNGVLSFNCNLGIDHWKQTVNPQCGKRGCVSSSSLVGFLCQTLG